MKFILILLILIPNLTYAQTVNTSNRLIRCIVTWNEMTPYQKRSCVKIPNFYYSIAIIDQRLEKQLISCSRTWHYLSNSAKSNCLERSDFRKKLGPIQK